MNMTPEQLRLLTDFMASAGAAIGGKGSVGDLVGQQVHNINAEQAAEQTRIRAEERESKKKAKAAQQMIRLLSGGQPSALPSDGKSYGVLKDDAGGEGTFTAQQPVTNLLSMLTPDGQKGPTSIAKDKKGNTIIKGMLDADVSEMNTNDILQTIYAGRMLEKAPKEDLLTDLQIQNAEYQLPTENEKILRDKMAVAGINLKEIVKLDIGNGQEVSLPLEEIVPFIIAEQQTPSSVKEARVLQKGGDEAKFLREILGSRASMYAPNTRAMLGEQGRTSAEIGGTQWKASVEKALANDSQHEMDQNILALDSYSPAEKAAAQQRIDARMNGFVLSDMNAVYRGKSVQYRKAFDINGQPIWAVIDAQGNDLGEYYPRFGETQEEYNARKAREGAK